MFDIGWSEMVFVAVIAVLVIGPKDLPRAIATVGKYIRKARGLARDFQSGIDDLAKEAELDDLKKDIQGGTNFDLKKQIEDAVDPTGDFDGMFDDIKPEIKEEKPANGSADPEPAVTANDSGAEAAPVQSAEEPATSSSETKVS